jgi:hypothetical protein
MSLVFKEAQKVVQDLKLKGYPEPVISSELIKLDLKQGEFKISHYIAGFGIHPEKLGMSNDCKMDKEAYDKIESFAKENGLRTKAGLFSIYLQNPMGGYEGIINSTSFYGSSPELFEAIGKQILGLKAEVCIETKP